MPLNSKNQRRLPVRRPRGFTMMELLITMMVVAILSAVSIPAMREFGVRANVSSTTNDLIAALNIARSEAVKRGRNVSVIAVGGNWSSGWTVTAADGTNLVVHGAVTQDYRVLGLATGTGAQSDRVIFTPVGALSVATAFDYSVCRPSFSPGDPQSRRIMVAASGLIRSRRNTAGAPAGSCA